MSVEAWQAIKRLEARVNIIDQHLDRAVNVIEGMSASLQDALARLDKLSDQYKMLNARMNKKNNGETDRE
jgi:archaellum component FlaC